MKGMYFMSHFALFVCVVGGLCLAGQGVFQIYGCLVAQGWPTADGTVTRSSIDSQKHYSIRGRITWTHDLAIVYRYEVNGKKYGNDRVTFAGRNRNSSSEAERYAKRFSVGATVKVHYNPAAPRDSVLDPSTTIWSWLSIVFGIAALPLGVVLMEMYKSMDKANKLKKAQKDEAAIQTTADEFGRSPVE